MLGTSFIMLCTTYGLWEWLLVVSEIFCLILPHISFIFFLTKIISLSFSHALTLTLILTWFLSTLKSVTSLWPSFTDSFKFACQMFSLSWRENNIFLYHKLLNREENVQKCCCMMANIGMKIFDCCRWLHCRQSWRDYSLTMQSFAMRANWFWLTSTNGFLNRSMTTLFCFNIKTSRWKQQFSCMFSTGACYLFLPFSLVCSKTHSLIFRGLYPLRTSILKLLFDFRTLYFQGCQWKPLCPNEGAKQVSAYHHWGERVSIYLRVTFLGTVLYHCRSFCLHVGVSFYVFILHC